VSKSPKPFDEQILTEVAAEIRRLRQLQGLSVQKLADATAAAGNPILRTAIADMELGRRKYITVGELMTLAYVLNVPPVTLMFPGPYERENTVELLPGVSATRTYGAQWWGGHLDGPPGESTEEQRKTYRNNTTGLHNAFEVWDLEAEIDSLARQMGRTPPGSTRMPILVERMVEKVLRVQQLLGIEPSESAPPPKSQVWSVDADGQLIATPMTEPGDGG
jgi:transcriptional regulator with XRE-family HTH domain